MGVGVDDAHDRTWPKLFVDECQRRPGGFLGGQRIENDPAGVALDEADVSQVETSHLVDFTGQHFIETIGHVKHGLPLQRGMNALEILAFQQEPIAGHVPGDVTGISHDLFVRRRGDEALPGLVEVPLVLEGQRCLDAVAQVNGELRRHLAQRVEVLAFQCARVR